MAAAFNFLTSTRGIMNLQVLLIIACSIVTGEIFSQTKFIAHKSHSGSAETFNISLDEEIFSNPGSNFGMAPERMIRTASLDSLIFLSDTVSVMITSRIEKDRWTDSLTIWKPGRDTIINHPLFSRVKGIENIKRSLKQDYYFRNSPDSVKFISYDTIRKPRYIDYETPGRRNDLPLLIRPDTNKRKPPYNVGVLICIIVAGFISLFSGVSFYRYIQIKQRFIN